MNSTSSKLRAQLRPIHISDWITWVLARWEQPVWSAISATIIAGIIAGVRSNIWQASRYAYYNYLADAFLRGQLFLAQLPPSTHDLSFFNNQYYLYWPPFPAVVLLPFVAIWDTGFNDILFTIGIGGLNVGLVAVLLRQATHRHVIDLSPVQRGLLVLTFALGSAHITLVPYGRVWHTGQLIGVLCVTLAYLATLSVRGWRAFALTGLAFGCALLTRNHLALAGLWPAVYLLVTHRQMGWRRLVAYSGGGALPVVLAIALLGMYNWLRFGNMFDNGLAYHRMSSFFRTDYVQYGAFNLYYVPTNLYYQFVAYPFPWRGVPSSLGGSLFLLTPVFVAAFWGLTARPRWQPLVLGATIILVAIPILLLMGTGWRQFGPRYTLDFTIPLLLLTALGLQHWPVWLLGVLTLTSVVQYLIGAVLLGGVI